MSDTTPNVKLPSVHFAERGDVTAAEAVGVDGPDSADFYSVYVLYPTGGRVYVSFEPEAQARNTARHLQDALKAWAELGR